MNQDLTSVSFIDSIATPAYVIDEAKLVSNLKILKDLEETTGAHVLLAQKAFSAYAEYPLIANYISGTTASGLYEARLGYEEMGKENHVFSPAYREEDMPELISICDHIIFNSANQLTKFKSLCLSQTSLTDSESAKRTTCSIGLRINPECSTQGDHAIYDPCAPGSRLGVTLANLEQAIAADPTLLDGVEGLHFHTLCEQNSDDLETTLAAVEAKFAPYLKQMKWLNMGGGHHITRADYDIDRLKSCILHMKETYGLEIYLEPGEAVALNAGYLVTTVMDVVENGISTLVLDASAACHMPDVLEMPYRPPLEGSVEASIKPYTYRLSSCTCLAGDIIGDYSFDSPKQIGDRLCFNDMAIYSMVKNNTFNGMPLPSIYALKEDGTCLLLKHFGYEDFKGRL